MGHRASITPLPLSYTQRAPPGPKKDKSPLSIWLRSGLAQSKGPLTTCSWATQWDPCTNPQLFGHCAAMRPWEEHEEPAWGGHQVLGRVSPLPRPMHQSALPTSQSRKKASVQGRRGEEGHWSSESAGAFSCGGEGQPGGHPHRQSWHKATWPLRKSRQGQSRRYFVLEPAQLKSRGSFCRKHSWPGWAKAGYRWFISDSMLSQGTCSLGGHHRRQSLSGHCPFPPPRPTHSGPRDVSRRPWDKRWGGQLLTVGRRAGPQADASGEIGQFLQPGPRRCPDSLGRGLRLCQGCRAAMWKPAWKVPSRSFLYGKH